jgi:hypothetical protein
LLVVQAPNASVWWWDVIQQRSGFIKRRPDMRERLWDLFQIILEETFGACLWYKCLMCLSGGGMLSNKGVASLREDLI